MNDQLIEKLFDRPIAFQRVFVDLTGSVQSALMLSQAFYWSKRTKEDGWFYKSSNEWQEETGLTRHEQDTARRGLKKHKFWQEKLKGVPATVNFRIDKLELFSSLTKTANLVCETLEFANNEQSGLPKTSKHSITETTTETTFEGSKEPSPQKDFFLEEESSDILSDEKTNTKARGPKKQKKEVDPFYPEFVRVWTEAYPEMGFDGMAGKKIKSLVAKTKAYLVAGGRDPSTAVQMWEYIIAYMKRGDTWFHGKDLGVIESKFNSLVFEIKNGKQKQQSPRTRTTTDALNDLIKTGKFNQGHG